MDDVSDSALPNVHEELWSIFTFYALHGDPLDPENSSQFLRLVKDCDLLAPGLTSSASVQVVYTSEVKRSKSGGDRMSYNSFLNALMRLAVQAFRDSRSEADAFERLLKDHVLPLACRRNPVPVAEFLADPDVQELFEYYEKALTQIFEYYATEQFTKKRTRRSPARGSGRNTMTAELGYREFLRFAMDFALSSSSILSTLELGDIFLSCVDSRDVDGQVGKLSVQKFKEALLRCALAAYAKISAACVTDKLKGLFLYMWRAMNDNVPRTFEGRSISTYAGNLMAGAMHFNTRFTAAWRLDNYRDYLSPAETEKEKARDVLSRMYAPHLSGTDSVLDAQRALLSARSRPRTASLPSSYASVSGPAPSASALLADLIAPSSAPKRTARARVSPDPRLPTGRARSSSDVASEHTSDRGSGDEVAGSVRASFMRRFAAADRAAAPATSAAAAAAESARKRMIAGTFTPEQLEELFAKNPDIVDMLQRNLAKTGLR